MRVFGTCPYCRVLDRMEVEDADDGIRCPVKCLSCRTRWYDVRWLVEGRSSTLMLVDIERGKYGVRVAHPFSIPFEDRIREVLNTALMTWHGLSNSHAAEGGVCGTVQIDGVEEYVELRCSEGLGLEDAVRTVGNSGADEVLESYWLMLLMLLTEEIPIARHMLRGGIILRLDDDNPDHALIADRLLGATLWSVGGGEEYSKLCQRIPEIALPSESALHRMKGDDFMAFFAAGFIFCKCPWHWRGVVFRY